MRIHLALLTVGVLIGVGTGGASQVPPASPASIASLAWMAGSWSSTADGVEMEEQWMAPRGGAMVGMHRDVVKGRMVSFEFFRIEKQNGQLVYLSSPAPIFGPASKARGTERPSGRNGAGRRLR